MDIVINRRPVSIPILPIVTGIFLVVLAFMSMRIENVEASQIGIMVNNLSGNVDVTTETGAHVYNGLYTDFYLLDNSTQTLRMAGDQGRGDQVNVKTDDGSDVSLDVELNYRLVQAPEVIRDVVVSESGLLIRQGREEVERYKLKWVRDYARSVVRYKFGELNTSEFYESDKRDTKARESEAELDRLLMPHGIDVVRVVPEAFSFYAEYETLVKDKQAADQEKDSQEQRANAARETQQLRTTEATAEANVQIARIRGELEKRVLEAQAAASKETLAAEAYAYSVKTAADAEFYKAKNDAQAIVAKATAEAQGLSQLATSLSGSGAANLVKLEYAKALQKATITGIPYAIDPRIQKVEISGMPAEAVKK